MTKHPRALVLCAAALLALSGCLPQQDDSLEPIERKPQDSEYFFPLTAAPDRPVMGQTVYIPVYSHIFVSGQGKRYLAATLSLRNTDFAHDIVITSVRYYNTDGGLIEELLDKPHGLKPMASATFFIDQNDARGGTGANFIVEWVSEASVNIPIMEAVMAGITGTQGVSFVSPGQVIQSR